VVKRSKSALNFSAAIFLQIIPLKTKYCLSEASLFCLGINKENSGNVLSLDFFASFFYQEKNEGHSGRRTS